MIASKTKVLNKLDSTLSNFLRAYAVKRLDYLTAESKIDNLREISFSNKPEYRKMDDRLLALEAWFEHNAAEIDRGELSSETIQQLIDCIKQIEIISRGGFGRGKDGDELFDRKLALNVANLANRFLNRVTGKIEAAAVTKSIKIVRSPEETENLPDSGPAMGETVKEKFIDSINYQIDFLEQYKDDKYHLFSIVEKLFQKLETQEDVKAGHLAASILYFMKLNGYKTAPYVEKLRKLSRNRHD